MSRQIQHSEINNLINSNEIKLDSARIGCCVRYYLTFPNDNHKYYYNSNKPISTILQNKISNHLYTMSKIRLNQKTTINDNIGIQLKFDGSVVEGEGRTGVNKDKFKEFGLEYQNSQSPLTNALDVEFEIHINMWDIDKEVEKTKNMDFAYDRVWWYPRSQTVY